MLDRDDPSTEPMHRLCLACLLERHLGSRESASTHLPSLSLTHFDAKGGRVLTCTEDGRAFLWDPYRSLPIASPLPHDAKVLCATLSPDGTRGHHRGRRNRPPVGCGDRSTTRRPLGIPALSPTPPSARTDSGWLQPVPLPFLDCPGRQNC